MTPEERRARDAARKRVARAADRAALDLPPRPPPLTPDERRAKDRERKRQARAALPPRPAPLSHEQRRIRDRDRKRAERQAATQQRHALGDHFDVLAAVRRRVVELGSHDPEAAELVYRLAPITSAMLGYRGATPPLGDPGMH